MPKKSNESLYDVRLVERNVRKGTVSAEELARHLAALPDQAANSVALFENKDANSTGIDN